MKKLASIVLVALFTLSTFAQRQHKKQQRPDYTVDQIAELQTKKMTLHLDLTEQQQEEILEINKRKTVERKQKLAERKAAKETDKNLTSDEIFAKKSAQLDKMIAHKAEMKKILSKEQFETWERSAKRKVRHIQKKRSKQNRLQKGKRK